MSLLPWLMTGVGPVELFLQMLRQSRYVTIGDTSLLGQMRLLLPYPIALTGLALVGVLTTAWLSWTHRGDSPLIAVSVAAVLGRLCLYHRQYDNVMLMFPLLTLGLLALNARKPWIWGAFAIYGITLWAPLPYASYHSFTILVLSAVWLFSLAIICGHAQQIPFPPGQKRQYSNSTMRLNAECG